MPREQKPIHPILVDYRCDECNTGFYRPHGNMLMCHPPKFGHECDNCGDKQTFLEKYPVIRYTAEGTLMDLTNYVEITC
jgi:hypothetical protein